MKDFLINFLIKLNEKGLINNYDFSYEEEAEKFLKETTPTRREKNNLPIDVKLAFIEAIEMYKQVQYFELGITDNKEFQENIREVKNRYTSPPAEPCA